MRNDLAIAVFASLVAGIVSCSQTEPITTPAPTPVPTSTIEANAGVCPTGRLNAHIRPGYGGSGSDDAYSCASRRPYTTVDSSDTNSYSTKTDCYAGCDSRATSRHPHTSGLATHFGPGHRPTSWPVEPGIGVHWA